MSKLLELVKKDLQKDPSTYFTFLNDLEFIQNNPKKYFEDYKIYKLLDHEKDLLNIIHNTCYDLFIKREAVASLKSEIIGPFLSTKELDLNNKDKKNRKTSDGYYLSTLTNNKFKKIKCIPYAIYVADTKKYYYLNLLSLYKKSVCNTAEFKNFDFCNYSVFSDIDKHLADALSLYLRLIVYSEINVYKNKIFLNRLGLNTQNLIMISSDSGIKGNPTMYILADYGIKDKNPKDKEVNKTLNTLASAFQLVQRGWKNKLKFN